MWILPLVGVVALYVIAAEIAKRIFYAHSASW